MVNGYDENGTALYFNGSRGIVKRFGDASVFVDFGSGVVEVRPYQWEEKWYSVDSQGKMAAVIVGTFEKVPLVLGYATTIHKSQGMTLDAANIDKNCNFQNGQFYVWLSRVKSKNLYIEDNPTPLFLML